MKLWFVEYRGGWKLAFQSPSTILMGVNPNTGAYMVRWFQYQYRPRGGFNGQYDTFEIKGKGGIKGMIAGMKKSASKDDHAQVRNSRDKFITLLTEGNYEFDEKPPVLFQKVDNYAEFTRKKTRFILFSRNSKPYIKIQSPDYIFEKGVDIYDRWTSDTPIYAIGRALDFNSRNEDAQWLSKKCLNGHAGLPV